MRVADTPRLAFRPSEQEVGEGEPRVSRAEGKAAASGGIIEAIHLIADDVAAQLQAMRAFAQRNAVAEFVIVVATAIRQIVFSDDEPTGRTTDQKRRIAFVDRC